MPLERDYRRPVMTLGQLVIAIGDPPPAVRRALRSKLARHTDLESANGWGYYRLADDNEHLEKTPLGHAATAFFADEDALLAWYAATAEEALRDLADYARKQLARAPLALDARVGPPRLVQDTARRGTWGIRLQCYSPPDTWVDFFPHGLDMGMNGQTVPLVQAGCVADFIENLQHHLNTRYG